MATFKLLSREFVNFVEIYLENEKVRTERGAMRYMLGDIEMESQPSGGVGGFFKALATGESFHKPVYSGTGKLVLEPSMSNYFCLEMENDEFILDQGAFWAADYDISVSAHSNKAAAALLSGEGWFQTSVKGTGTVIVCAPGPVEVIDLKNDKLVVDGSFAVARSASLHFEVSRSTKSLFGSVTSGEGLVNTISGTGRVYIAPIPNRHMLGNFMFGLGRAGA